MLCDASGVEAVILPGTDDAIGIFPTVYRVPYKYLGTKFKAAMYHKVTYISHYITTATFNGDICIKNTIGNTSPGTWKILNITAKIEFFVCVNGVSTRISEPCYITEKHLYLSSEENIGLVCNRIGYFLVHAYSYSNYIWFDTQGRQPYPMRCMFTEANGRLLFSFDLYEANIAHDIAVVGGFIGPNYNDGSVPFPPFTDAYYEPTDRQWWLFKESGDHTVLESPRVLNEDGMPTVFIPNRLNALNMFSNKVAS